MAVNDLPPVAPVPSPDVGKPDRQIDTSDKGQDPDQEVDIKWLEMVLTDAERAEQDFRRRGREIIQIYRNDIGINRSVRSKSTIGNIVFNILYSNTEVMLPAIYQNPPQPVVRSRFTGGSMPVPPPPPPAPIGPLLGPAPPMPVPPPPDTPDALPPQLAAPAPAAPLPMPGGPLPQLAQPIFPGANPFTPPPPSRPDQKDVETAAAIMEKALEIVLDDEASHEAVQTAIKDVLLPGRGVARVRWNPDIQQKPVMSGDGVTPLPPSDPDGEPPVEDVKVWETVTDEYVYWEDILVDPVRQANDMQWIAFRHLFTKEQLIGEFEGQPKFDKLVADGKIDTLLQWTEESAAKSPPSGGGYARANRYLGDVIKKAMVWEIWDKVQRRIIWYIRESSGLVMRVDPDSLQLDGFFPIPVPLLAVVSSDTRVPKPYYDLYAKLAEDLDETSRRISKLITQIKVRGGYNSASNEIADILRADDGKMIAVDGVDMMGPGGLQNHIYLLPIEQWVNCLNQLYIARDQQKQAIYEIMGISDLMRGATKASETATAQRIKGSMGMVRLSDLRADASTFAKDLLRLKAQIIAKNFDAETLEKMTGETVTPPVLAILRSDFQRACSIDVETDSTVSTDEQAEQQAMAMTMQAIQSVMQGIQGMLMTGVLPPQQVILLGLEMLDMVLHPVRYSRGVVQLLNDFKEQLQSQMMMGPVPPPARHPVPADRRGRVHPSTRSR